MCPEVKSYSIRVIVIVNTTRITVILKSALSSPNDRAIVEPVKDIPGMPTFGFYLDAADENSSLLISEWETESDLDHYVRSNNFAILRGAIKVLSIRSTDSKALVTSPVSRPDKSLENVITKGVENNVLKKPRVKKTENKTRTAPQSGSFRPSESGLVLRFSGRASRAEKPASNNKRRCQMIYYGRSLMLASRTWRFWTKPERSFMRTKRGPFCSKALFRKENASIPLLVIFKALEG